LTVEVFPREKLGQFCSANQLAHASVTFLVGSVIGILFDDLKN